MSMSWFRMYNSFLHEPNVQRLPPPAFKIYVNCLCIASANDPRGSLPSLENLAFLLKVSDKKMEKFFNFLKNSELFEEKNGLIFIREWDKKQFESDNVTVRTQRHRERRERCRERSGNVAGNVPGTPPDTDTDTDTELKNPPISPQWGEAISQPSLLVDSEPQQPTVAAIKKSQLSTTEIPSPSPDLVDPTTWQAWLDHRRSLKKPVTPNGATMVFKQLDQARQLGHDPNEMLETAIANGWQGCVFEKHRQARQQETKPNQKSPVPSFRDIPKTNTAYAGSAF